MRRLLFAGLMGLLLVVLCLVPGPADAQEPARGLLWIPVLNLIAPVVDAPIIQVDGQRVHAVPDSAVGWLEGTVWLGAAWGRIVLAAHTPGTFEHIDELIPGDVIWLVDATQAERYTVTGQVLVDVTETGWLAPTDDETLLLVTCAGIQRLLVEAEKG